MTQILIGKDSDLGCGSQSMVTNGVCFVKLHEEPQRTAQKSRCCRNGWDINKIWKP